jgi:xanthine dehydrogenase small subunit
VIRFNLNGEWIEDGNIDPMCTILNYLRTQMAQTDVKEGCAAGDCGACTVMLASLDNGQLSFYTVNACIALMAHLHNRYIFTAQGIAQQSLHPAQQAMIDFHGSQCGFCTPGIVMSLATLYQQRLQQGIDLNIVPSDHDIHAALSGNLCRCTGYQPIVSAARHMGDYPKRDCAEQVQAAAVVEFDPNAGVSREPLQQSASSQLFMPQTEAELIALLQQYPTAQLWAGGTDLGLAITQQFKTMACVIVLGRVQGLSSIEIQNKQMSLGALCSYSDVEQELTPRVPSLAELVQRIGSRQIRNLGTLGGNIANASPIGDMPPAFLALGAEVEINGIYGLHNIALEQFFTGYKQTQLRAGEYIRRIIFNLPQENDHVFLWKISKRHDDDISAVMFALKLSIENETIIAAKLALGGMAATPIRAYHVESGLIGQPVNLATFKQAGRLLEQDCSPMSDVRASASYRLQVGKNLLLRAALELTRGTVQAEVAS